MLTRMLNIFLISFSLFTIQQIYASTIDSGDKIEDKVKEKLQEKSVSDINWSLYGKPRDGEKIEGNVYNNFLKKHQNIFCSSSSGVEKAWGTKACKKNILANEYGDIKADSLLFPLKYTDAEKVAAEDFIRNLTSPFPNSDLKNLVEEGSNKLSDKKKLAKLMAMNVFSDIARNSLNSIYGDRIEFNKTSIIEIMDNYSKSRILSSEWNSSMNSNSDPNIFLKELVQMQAFKLWMDYHKYRQSERVEALLAALVIQNNEVMTQTSNISESATNN